jgi:hypothetical protein
MVASALDASVKTSFGVDGIRWTLALPTAEFTIAINDDLGRALPI